MIVILLGAQCSGIRQSPIDLDTRSLSKARVAGVFFNSGYSEVPATQTVQSDGHSSILKTVFRLFINDFNYNDL